MVTIQKNSLWHEKTEVKKGDYGEDLVRRILEDCGFIVYQAITDGAHLIDFIVELNKNLIFAVDVKTKPKFKDYPATGLNFHHYETYKEFSKKAHMPVMIIFVDETLKEIYGNFLHVLDEPRRYYNMRYPGTFKSNGITIRYYPLNAMCKIALLSDKDVALLKNLRRSDYD